MRAIILFVLLLKSNIAFCEIQDVEPLCGPRCLQALCIYNNIETTIDELCELSNYNVDYGTNMYMLYEAAQKKGLQVHALKLSIKELCESGSYAIVNFNNNHFSLVISCESDSITIQDYPDIPEKIGVATFLEKWNGAALLFPKNENKNIQYSEMIDNSPNITFSERTYDFGRVDEGEILNTSFKFTNTGKDTLKIRTVRASCSCTSGEISKQFISPGEEGEIIVKYDTSGDSNGLHKQSVFVQCNDPNEPLLTLAVYATIVRSIEAVPAQIWIDNAHVNENIIREISIIDHANEGIEIESINFPEGVTGKIYNKTTNNENSIIPITIEINTGAKSGPIEKEMVIHTNREYRPDIHIKIMGLVYSDAQANPPALIFGSPHINEKLKKETIVTISNPGIKNITAKTTNEYIHLDTKKISDDEYSINVTLNCPAKETVVEDSITITDGSNNNLLEIPIYATIKK